MLTTFRAAVHRFTVRQRLQEVAYSTSDRQLRAELGGNLRGFCRRAVRSGWSTRTTAGVLAAIWIWRRARDLGDARRMQLGRAIVEQERAGLTPLDWIHEFESGRMNVVGIDVFLLRFNYAHGIVASWIVEGRPVDPGVKRILLAMAAWGLSGMDESEVEDRLEGMLDELHA